MILVARPNHRANEERHIRHERRYSTAVRSSIGCPQKGERGIRRRTAFVRRWRACAAWHREEAGAGGAPCVVHAGPAQSRADRAPARGDVAASKIEIARLMAALVDGFCESYRRAPSSITLDIDDTCDTVHGHQQLSLFNAHYDELCFLPIHIYDAASGKPVAMILREGKTPSGEEVRTVLKHVIKRIRRHWPKVDILVRGDSHYGRDEAMEWCEETQGVDYVFGFAGNDALHTDRK